MSRRAYNIQIPPHGTHAGFAFRAYAGTNVLAQRHHSAAVEGAVKIRLYLRIRRPRNEEAGLHAAGRADDGGELRCVAAYRRVGPKPKDGGEILQDALQLLRTLGDEAGTKVLPVALLHGIQYSFKL